jgi:hypothetical protein
VKPRLAYLSHTPLSKYDRETIALTCILMGSLVGLGLCWWLG